MTLTTHTSYSSDHAVRVPTDGRLWLALLWLIAFTLLVIDTTDHRFGIAGAWGIFVSLVATAWTGIVLHAYSRRIVLDVMSFEHRQQTGELGGTPVRSVAEI